ncbi:MAG TPA: 6-hydroxymethylpterin diphosphokinase MptE-like protein, partial [bacterium]|nr:6-hydroxymethylpterin diphosphokinase MptE-like protein [bacterium]
MPETQGDRVLRENLQALSTRNRDLAATVSAATPDPRFTTAPSRSGSMVPAVKSAAGTTPLHSQYDPRAEARRLMDAGHASRGADGFLALFGLGGGFLAEAALEDSSTWHVLVVEKDPSVLLTLLTHVPLGRLLADPRVTVVCGLPGIRPALLSNWKPALMGGMKVVPLRPWFDRERPFFDRAAAEVSAAVDAVRSDYSVQSHFGKRWFANMLANLPRVRTPSSPSAVAAAVVTAAGPSLEQHTAALAGRGKDVLVVATDASLPALLRAGVEPDAVLSIDCQIYGYHHFMQGLPPTTALYLDLSSPPQLARRFPRARFVAGGHPFARYVDAHWMHLPVVDTSGGNVTHAAVTLARGLGAERITVRGADFSYPDAKPYARGTYLY